MVCQYLYYYNELPPWPLLLKLQQDLLGAAALDLFEFLGELAQADYFFVAKNLLDIFQAGCDAVA